MLADCGVLLCCEHRRHSEATASMKPSRPADLAFSSCRTPYYAAGGGPGSTLLLEDSTIEPAAAVADESTGPTFSGHCVRITGDAGSNYDFCDSAASLLGRGSYGIVFRGRRRCDAQHSQTLAVAIKRMWRVNMCPNELEAMKRVQNPNLVTLLDVCQDGDGDGSGGVPMAHLVMELCDTDLDAHLKSAVDGKLNAPDMRVVVQCIANGYLALYEHRVVHRDIKPQNILLLLLPPPYGSDAGHYRSQQASSIACAKITDFGVSRVLADDVVGGALCCSNVAGTLAYMAPEVGANLITTSEYDHSADMWSIGCLFYQCLTGKTPFDECSLCRLFLQCAGANFDAYEVPPLPAAAAGEGADARALAAMITALLQIDRARRATPRQLYAHTVCNNPNTVPKDD